VTETVLANDDIPWEVLKRRGHESVRLMELTRYICRQKRRETQRIVKKERLSRKNGGTNGENRNDRYTLA